MCGKTHRWAHASGEECVQYAAKAAKAEGMMIGPSAGAALKVASEVGSRAENEGKTIVVVFASHAIRYTQGHPLWAAGKAEALKALPSPPNMDKAAELIQWKSEDYKPE